jgi:hypothetical protein
MELQFHPDFALAKFKYELPYDGHRPKHVGAF